MRPPLSASKPASTPAPAPPTESLTALNWQLAPVGGAKPVEVAALLLKLGTYRAALEQIAKISTEDFAYVGDLKVIAEEALK